MDTTDEETEDRSSYQFEAHAAEYVADTEEAAAAVNGRNWARAQLGQACTFADDGDEDACTTQVREILVNLTEWDLNPAKSLISLLSVSKAALCGVYCPVPCHDPARRRSSG